MFSISVISGQVSKPSVGQNEGHESRATQSGKYYSGSAGFLNRIFFLLQGPENGSNNDAFWWDGDQLVLSCGHGQVVYLPATSGLCE